MASVSSASRASKPFHSASFNWQESWRRPAQGAECPVAEIWAVSLRSPTRWPRWPSWGKEEDALRKLGWVVLQNVSGSELQRAGSLASLQRVMVAKLAAGKPPARAQFSTMPDNLCCGFVSNRWASRRSEESHWGASVIFQGKEKK